MTSPYIRAETDWREKPSGFITALETVVAGSEPTQLATATLMSRLNIQVGVWGRREGKKSLSTLQNIFPSSLARHLLADLSSHSVQTVCFLGRPRENQTLLCSLC